MARMTSRVFISYSHDSLEHKQWVLDLATRLRNSGVDAIIDQWEIGPGDDIPHFMERELTQADFVVMICTEQYVEKANAGEGGVGYEKMIVTSSLLSNIDESKVIPVIRQQGTTLTPTFLNSKLYIDFSDSSEFEYAIDQLTRKALNAPLFQKPEIGSNPYEAGVASMPQPTSDPLLEVMRVMAGIHETSSLEYMMYQNLRDRVTISRTLLDLELVKAEEQRLIHRLNYEYLKLTPQGLHYLVEHNLI